MQEGRRAAPEFPFFYRLSAMSLMPLTSCNDNQFLPITVVIATLGGDRLKETIHHLNAGSIVPDEILICIPASESHKVSSYSFPNVKVVATSCKGQVAQRVVGFKNASHSYVMQLDDDLLVDEHCVEHLLQTSILHGPKAAVAPAFLWAATRESFYKAPANKTLLRWYYWLLNGSSGYQPGTITHAGTNIGIDPSAADREALEADWIAGGCVMHRRENLVLENFYPYKGKAFCEDILHSHHLKAKGVKLLVSARAVCWLDNPPLWNPSWSAFFRDLVFDFRARQFFVRLTSRSPWRMILFYVISVLRYGYFKLFKKAF
jgi:glycosyltransferase involved in cell wall biosynthesis